MHLAALLQPSQIIASMRAVEHWSAIVELVDCLVECGRIPAAGVEQILAGLKAREDSMSTGIGYGLAIPHTSSPHVSEVVAAFGRAPRGIEFGALDNKPVNYLVLFIVPESEFQLHLRTLSAIARFLNEPGMSDRLSLAADSKEIYSILSSNAGRR